MANEKRLIDANALLNNELLDSLTNIFDKARARLIILSAPTVDAVEVVHAKWENVQNGKGCCSNCHRLDGIDPLATHCRYCGAKMDGDGNV